MSGWVKVILAGDPEKAKKEIQIINQNKECDKFGILLTRSLEKLYRNNGSMLVNQKQKREKKVTQHIYLDYYAHQKTRWKKCLG